MMLIMMVVLVIGHFFLLDVHDHLAIMILIIKVMMIMIMILILMIMIMMMIFLCSPSLRCHLHCDRSQSCSLQAEMGIYYI